MSDIGELQKKLNDFNCIDIVCIARTAITNAPLGVAMMSQIVSFAEKGGEVGNGQGEGYQISSCQDSK